MRAAALAAAVIAGFIGVMYVRFSGDTVPAPPAHVADQPTCIVFRKVSAEEGGDGPEQPATCGAVRPIPTQGPLRTPPPPRPLRHIDDARVVSFEFGAEIEFPPDVVMLVEGGCFQCDPPRVYRDPSGASRIESLFSPEKVGLSPRLVETESGVIEEPPFVTGFATNDGGSEIIAGVCVRGSCGGWYPLSHDALTVFYRSTDGGVTWSNYAETAGYDYPVGLVQPGIVLVSVQEGIAETASANGPYGSYKTMHRLFPSGEAVPVPFGSGLQPVVASSGDIFWADVGGGILTHAGKIYFAPPGPRSCCSTMLWYDPKDSTGAASMHYDAGAYLVKIGQNGRVQDAFQIPNEVNLHVYNPKEEVSWGLTSGFQDQLSSPPQDGMFRLLPIIVDLRTRRMNLVGGPFLERPLAGARNTVYAVGRGPFARVVNTDGTCLNVRDGVNLGSPVLECGAEGVLLRTDGSTGGDGTNVFLHVFTPAGVEGWASTQYLERLTACALSPPVGGWGGP